MEGELKILTVAFNQMARRLQGAYDDLEQRVVRRTEESQESEEKYRTLFEGSMDAIFITSEDERLLDSNQAMLDLLGVRRDEAIGSNVWNRVNPVNTEKFWEELNSTGSVKEFEARLSKDDGIDRYCLVTASRWLDGSGKFLGVQGIVRDITERRRVEEALVESELRIRKLAASTIRAHEEERQWAAMEVHDRISQTLVGLARYIQAVESMTSDDLKVRPLARRASELLQESILASRNIMNELYPAGLEDFGIARLIEVALERFEETAKCQASFHHNDVTALDQGLAVTLFRIFQEAMANVGRHAAASHVCVSLTFEDEAITLEVIDDGSGFEPEKDGGRVGGLMSMRRRAELIGGSLDVTTSPGHGTTVIVRVPIEGANSPPE